MIAGLPPPNMAGPASGERPTVKERITGVFRLERRAQDRRSRQVEEYVAWVNSHLKKRAGSPLIYDLRSMQDGVTLVSLVEVLSQCEVSGVDRNPSSPLAKATNLEVAVTFLRETGVRLPDTALTDLKEGSLKGTLKVILALAQHYHPMSIRHSVKGGRNHVVKPSGRDSAASTPYRSTYSPVQQVITADESLSQDVYGSDGGLPPRYVQLPGGGAKQTLAAFHLHYVPVKGYEGEEQCSITHTSDTPSPDLGGVSPFPSASSFAHAHRSHLKARDTPISGFTGVSGVMPYTDSMISPPATGSSGDQSPAPPPAPAGETALPSLDCAMADIAGLKGHLLQLYALLRDNPDGQEADSQSLADHSWSSSELLGPTGSFMTPIVEESPEVLQLRDDVAAFQSECQMLREVVEGKEEMVRQLKSDILRLDYKTETEREELRNMVSEKQLVINELDLRLEEKSAATAEQQQKLEKLEEQLRQQQKLHLESVQVEEEVVISDMKAGSFARGLTRGSHIDSVAAEVDVIRQSMSALRKEAQSTQHKALDRLEEAVSHLMDHINTMATKRARHERHKERDRKPKRLVSADSTPTKTMETVKVMYTLDKDDTPYRINVPHSGPHGPTLAEFKAALGRKGHFKYFFKATEEGSSVKVEVTDEAAPLPTTGGKYVAWVTTLQ